MEGGRLPPPDPHARVVEDAYQGADFGGAEAAQEVAGRGGVGNAPGSRRYLDMGHLQDGHGEYVDLGGVPGEATGGLCVQAHDGTGYVNLGGVPGVSEDRSE